MTDKQALILIDSIVANAIDHIAFDNNNEQKTKEGYLEGIIAAIAAVFEVKGRPDDEKQS